MRIPYGLIAKVLESQTKTQSRTGNCSAPYSSRPWRNVSKQFLGGKLEKISHQKASEVTMVVWCLAVSSQSQSCLWRAGNLTAEHSPAEVPSDSAGTARASSRNGESFKQERRELQAGAARASSRNGESFKQERRELQAGTARASSVAQLNPAQPPDPRHSRTASSSCVPPTPPSRGLQTISQARPVS